MMDTYHGHVRTPADAIKLFEACRLGLLPRVQRRLSEKERQSIKSGSVFVWDEREAGMRRWTDGKSWSASRVSGSFLTYREMEGKRGGGQFIPPPPPVRRTPGKTPESGRGSDEDLDLDGEGPDGYRYKPDGLMKQSFSITTSTGQHLHLISYYSRPHPNVPELPTPTSDPQLRHIVPIKGMYPESTVHEAHGPAVTRSPMQSGPYMQAPHHGMHGQHRGSYGYQNPPSYAWPPSPVSTPPFHPYPGQMYNSGLPPPHHSPYPPPIQHHIPQGLVQTYDRPPPPPIAESSLPHPPHLTHPRGMSTATAAQQGLIPSYSPNSTQQARLIAEQAQRALQSAPMIDPRISSPSTTTLPPVQVTDPRPITPQPQPQNGTTAQNNTNTPTSTGRSSPKDGSSKPNTTTATGATSIPSISHLVHATDSPSVAADNKNNSSRAGSKSPKSSQNPKDIPHDKLNIGGEDQRAIRVLDRKFMI